MKKFMLAALLGTTTGVLVTTQVTGPLLAQESDRTSSVYEQLDLFGDIFERIRAQYVEEVEDSELIEAAINGMLTSLDPHSSYLSANDFEDMRTQTSGEFGGLGIEVTQEEGYVKVVTPMDDTPADKAGMEAGDFITAVDGESILGLNLEQAVELMRGPVGSEIILTVVREGADEPFDVSIIRDTIKLTAVRARTEGDSVVLRVSTFNRHVAGALQDHGRAVVIGEKSFGKGSVQTVVPVRGDGAMRLTTSRYYTPSGRSIQALGVAPDIIVVQPRRDPNAEVAEEEETNRPSRSEADLRGSLSNDDISEAEREIIAAEQEKAEKAAELREEDYQLAYALDILKGLSAIANATGE